LALARVLGWPVLHRGGETATPEYVANGLSVPASPNPRLQRTRLRAPLSRQPFGDFTRVGGDVLTTFLVRSVNHVPGCEGAARSGPSLKAVAAGAYPSKVLGLLTIVPPNPRLQRTRQLTRFRRQLQLTLGKTGMPGSESLPSNQMGCRTTDSSLDERALRPLLDGRFVASATREFRQAQLPARLRTRNRLAGKRQLVRCPLNRVKIPRSAPLRSPLSRKPFGGHP
jgi:hypothetical protein